MEQTKIIKPDYLFEVSWEICNKVGGIYTVISTKALTLAKELGDNYILIGPDVWKETRENPDFIEDPDIFKPWREKVSQEGLNIRIGRWNVAGQPIVFLVDFTPYFSVKDEIFYEFWEKYKLDSLTGQWDYIEPALFGYAAARVIESFYEFNLSASDRIVAQFHEWMTGTGILYLKDKIPQVGTIFTTHATVLGRSIAGNGLPLYKDLKKYNGNRVAKDFGIVSKYSLERLSAQESDCFTTVSDITSKECSHFLGREVDVVTVNGFENSFVPESNVFEEKRKTSRKKIRAVIQGMLNQKIQDDSMFMIISGRYEYRNKGIDLYLDALGKLNKSKEFNRTVVAFITVPAHQSGVKQDLVERIKNPDFQHPLTGEYLTHHLYDEQKDPILKSIRQNELLNSPDDNVKVIFVPAYLDGLDGIFDLSYYDLLIGFDFSVFPSYYEPWGYTPLESAAFHIPSITTNLAGFGLWVLSLGQDDQKGIFVIDRDKKDDQAVADIVEITTNIVNETPKGINKNRKDALTISQQALWSNFIEYYRQAYSIALKKVERRADLFKGKLQQYRYFEFKDTRPIQPVWEKVYIKADIPQKLEGLPVLSKNLWWSWNYEAGELFETINKQKWHSTNHNPVALLESLSYERLKELESDRGFVDKLNRVYNDFRNYMEKASEKPKEKVAYFCMEYGLHESLKIYSGGLGVLAGDYLKEASDSNKNITGVGLLYHYGYFQQQLSAFGEQVAEYKRQKFTQLPLTPVRDKENNWIKISIALPGRTLYARVWRVDVGRIPLFLLDTDIKDNAERDRTITHQLYGGDIENRLKQELLLGVGGIRMLDALDINPDIYHCNEGHAAFLGIERLRNLVQFKKLTFNQAIEVVRPSTLFTTHTPVPAGHDTFSEDLLRTYIPHYAESLNINWNRFMNLGRVTENAGSEKFSMSVLAVRLSQEVNGVSKIHGRVSREMFNNLFQGYFQEELCIGHITNGVHYPTWTSKSFRKLYENEFDKQFYHEQDVRKYWRKIQEIPDEVIWEHRMELKKRLVNFLRERLTDNMSSRQESPNIILRTIDSLDEKNMIIGFARRFATYKRAHLLFNDLDRLSGMLNNPDRPVQIVFAGKAHPNDKAGQEFIKRIVDISRKPEFIGKVFFIENYDMYVAQNLVQGVDIWMNTPTRPMEASGTSGQKAVMNGVLNFSVLDGWWAEAYKEKAGWAIKESRTYDNQQFQDELDAGTIYNILENDIIPLYFKVDNKNIPTEWITYIKNCISGIAYRFTMKRMLNEYYDKYYNKLFEQTKLFKENNYQKALELADWKQKLRERWDQIQIISARIPDLTPGSLKLGDVFKAEIKLNTHDISPSDIGIEVLFRQKNHGKVECPLFVKQLQLTNYNNNIASFSCEFPVKHSGALNFAFRIYPSNELLPHRQDFNLVKWI